MKSHQLKQKFRNGETTIGSWISLGHSGIAEIFAQAGFDWLVVDLEHSVISIDMAADLIRVIDLCGSVPLVRLTANDPNQVKRIMDAGAHGIVVPMVSSVDEAVQAVAATRYAPTGRRGVGLARAQRYGPGFEDYLYWQKEDLIVIVQIEDQAAMDQLDKIFTVPGVDAFIIGPYDLSCSMGIPGEFDRPEFEAAMKRILETGHRVGCPAGIHLVEPDPVKLRELVEQGYQFVAYSVDIRMLDVSARIGIQVRETMERK